MEHVRPSVLVVAALAVYAALVPFGSAFALDLPLPGPFATASTLVGAVCIGLLVLSLMTGGERVQRLSSATPVWLLLLAYTGLTFVWSKDRDTTLYLFAVLASVVLLYTLLDLVTIDRRGLRVFEGGIVAGGVLTGGYGMLLALTGGLPDDGPGVDRFRAGGAGGEVGDPNITAAAMLLPLALVTMGAVRAESWRARILFLAAGVTIVVGIAATGSRGGLVGVLITWVACALSERKRGSTAALVGVAIIAAVVAALVAPASLGERVTDPSSTGRWDMWRIGMLSCPEYCWIGSGMGTFPDVHEERMLTDPEASNFQLRYEAHNIFVSAVVETGLPGLLLLTTGLLLLLRGVWRVPPPARTAAFAGLVGVIVANLFLSTLVFKYVWLLFAYVVVLIRVEGASAQTPPDRDTKVVFT